MLCKHTDRSRIPIGKLPYDLTLAHFQNSPQSRMCSSAHAAVQACLDAMGYWDLC